MKYLMHFVALLIVGLTVTYAAAAFFEQRTQRPVDQGYVKSLSELSRKLASPVALTAPR